MHARVRGDQGAVDIHTLEFPFLGPEGLAYVLHIASIKAMVLARLRLLGISFRVGAPELYKTPEADGAQLTTAITLPILYSELSSDRLWI